MPWYVSPVDVATPTPGGGLAVWSVLSHLLFFVFVTRAAMLRNYLGGVLVLLLTVVSMGYHWCQGGNACAGIELPQWQVFDHGTASQAAIVIVWMFMVAPAPTHTTRTRLLAFLLSFLVLPEVVLYMSLMTHPTDLTPTLNVVATLAMGVGIFYALFRVEPLVPRSHPEYHTSVYTARPIWLGAGFATGAIAIFFFVVPDPTGLLHSFWHVFISVSLICFQEALFQLRAHLRRLRATVASAAESLPIRTVTLRDFITAT
jgi:hypothetical protein